MPRIIRLHFASLGHHDARFPALTLDFRDAQGRAADSVIWAENSTGKSSLLSLFFSTYRPNQRLFLGKQAESKARELGDYLRDRDLGFIVTEWDTTEDRAEASLLVDGPREVLLVGQVLSWRGLDKSTGELRRRFFTLRAGRDVTFDTLPILGLGEPVASYEAFSDWLDAQAKAHPRLAIVHTTNQTEWCEHLESNHLDPELFRFQLRMNEREGGINNLFNELKRDADFIHEFLKLGFDPATANEVRANLDAFLPKLRRRDALELQLEFNQKLLVELDLLTKQLGIWKTAKERGETAEREAGSLLSALVRAKEGFDANVVSLGNHLNDLEGRKTQLESARTTNGRRQNFFKRLQAHLEVGEAEAELKRCEQASTAAQLDKRLVEMATLLWEMRTLTADADALKGALEREQAQAKPVLKALQVLGAAYKSQITKEAESVALNRAGLEQQRAILRGRIKTLNDERTSLVAEQSTKQQEVNALDEHFGLRETHRERLRKEGWLEAKEAAADAMARWQDAGSKAKGVEDSATRELTTLRTEQSALAVEATQLSGEIANAKSNVTQLTNQIRAAETEEERLSMHEQMRAAIEASRADLNLPQTLERLSERAASLFRQILRLNVGGAEDERAQASVDKQRLFPPHRDVEALVEKLRAAGVRSATSAAHWLAYNFTDPQPAADLLANDPARFGGVLFDAAADGARVREALLALRTEQLAVVVAPTPDAIAQPSAAVQPTAVVLPRHTGGFNFTVAQAEAEKLTSIISARVKELETLSAQLNATKTLLDELGKWLTEFGGAKLGMVREKLRGEQQGLGSFQERQQKNTAHQHEVTAAIATSEKARTEARAALQSAEKAVAQLGNFIERFDADYEGKRARQTELGSRLQAIGVELPELNERRLKLEADENPLETRLTELGVEFVRLRNEAGEIVYAGTQPAIVTDSTEQLRARYKTEALQYEGRFLNSKAQGELTAKQAEIRNKEQKLATDFSGLRQAAAEAKRAAGDLSGQFFQAETKLALAQQNFGAAKLALEGARERFANLGAAGEQERPGQGESVPATSLDAGTALSSLESEYVELQKQLEANRNSCQSATESKSGFVQRATDYGNHADRLRDQSAPADISPTDLPGDDAQVRALTEERLKRLKQKRGETQSEHEKLRNIHARISDLTQEERFARAMDLPARSLFSHMPLEELILSAGDKQNAVKEETLVLEADLTQMNQHRETLVESLLKVCEQAGRLLHRAERWSVLPDDMGEWAGEPFLRIRLRLSPNRADNLARLKSLADFLFAEGKIPPAIELVFRGLTALVGEAGIDATILKPETQRRRVRYPVREMGGWSEGERTTVAILLYCTLVKIRAQSRGHAGRRAEVSALLLDNPVGPCSKPEFLKMHRWIARQLGVQLIYATGINDPAALSVFPNRLRLAKNRYIPATGELAVGLVQDAEDSIISDIRIFDGTEKVSGNGSGDDRSSA